jgi:hypothetical protein
MINHDLGALFTPKIEELFLPLIYPNPTDVKGFIGLNSYAGYKNEIFIITGWDINGKKVLESNLIQGNKLDLAKFKLTAGMYYIIVQNSKGETIVKQNIVLK